MLTRIFTLSFLVGLFVNVVVVANEEKEDLSPSYDIHATMLVGVGAKSKEDGMRDQKLAYSEGKAGFTYKQPFQSGHNLLISLNYYLANLKWKENPHFKKDGFHRVGFLVGGQTEEIENWNLNASVEAIFNTIKFGFNDYAIYQGTFWGRYSYSSDIGFYIGVFAETGLKKKIALPILGFDYLGFDKWEIFVVFPLKMTAIYSFNDQWSASVSGRYFRTRCRVDKNENNPKSIFDYTAFGAEGAIHYSPCDKFSAKLFAGSNLGSDLRIRNRAGENNITYSFKPAPYFGIGANINL